MNKKKSKLNSDSLRIGSYEFSSRLMVGTGKYKSMGEAEEAIVASGAEVITVAVRRANLGQDSKSPNLLDVFSPERFTILPNTAGCYDAKSAVRTCLLARELLDGHPIVKLEVLGDEKTLYPNVVETISAAKLLCKEDFEVWVYTSDDPVVARKLEDIGCSAIMPLAAPIGSGLGIRNKYSIRAIVEKSRVPVVVDAGVGTASDASLAMELGCDGVLMNTAIAGADNPSLMASAMGKAVTAGREAYLAGRIPRKAYGSASSPIDGKFFD